MSKPRNLGRKKITLKGEYKEFKDFYSVNKIIIYRNIIKLLEKFKDNTKEELILSINSRISGTDWDTELKFERSTLKITLVDDLMPYFEEMEDYETCMEIKTLYEELLTWFWKIGIPLANVFDIQSLGCCSEINGKWCTSIVLEVRLW